MSEAETLARLTGTYTAASGALINELKVSLPNLWMHVLNKNAQGNECVAVSLIVSTVLAGFDNRTAFQVALTIGEQEAIDAFAAPKAGVYA